jgi:hypothetical protein
MAAAREAQPAKDTVVMTWGGFGSGAKNGAATGRPTDEGGGGAPTIAGYKTRPLLALDTGAKNLYNRVHA